MEKFVKKCWKHFVNVLIRYSLNTPWKEVKILILNMENIS